MSGSTLSRRGFVEEMQKFVEDECAQIGNLLAHFSWTPDHILKSKPLVECPHNPSHCLPEASLKKHAAECQLKMCGCPKQDLELQLQNDDIFYEKADLVGKIKIDEQLLNSIIWNHCMENGEVYSGHRSLPVCPNDATTKLLREERLAVYSYCVEQFKSQGKMANVEKDEVLTTDWEKIIKKGLLDESGDKPKTKAQLLTMLRDQKRRRQSYRAKNVHVTKKSYTEIIREVISNQMEILSPYPEEEDNRALQQPVDDQLRYWRDRDRDSSHADHARVQQGRSRSRSRSPKRRKSPSPRRRQSRDRSDRRSRTESRQPDRESRQFEGEYGKHRDRSRAEDRAADQRDSGKMQSYRDEDSYLADHGDVRHESETSDSPRAQRSRHSKSAKKKKHKHKKHKSKQVYADSEDD